MYWRKRKQQVFLLVSLQVGCDFSAQREAPKGGLHGTASAMQHAGDAANVAAAAAATAMRWKASLRGPPLDVNLASFPSKGLNGTQKLGGEGKYHEF